MFRKPRRDYFGVRKPNRGQFGAGGERYVMMDRSTVEDIIEDYIKGNKIFRNLKELYVKEYEGNNACGWTLSNFIRVFKEINYRYKYDKTKRQWVL